LIHESTLQNSQILNEQKVSERDRSIIKKSQPIRLHVQSVCRLMIWFEKYNLLHLYKKSQELHLWVATFMFTGGIFCCEGTMSCYVVSWHQNPFAMAHSEKGSTKRQNAPCISGINSRNATDVQVPL
jgi:hypothetical protein